MAALDAKQQASLNAVLYDAVISRNLDRVKLCISRGSQLGPADMGSYFSARSENPVPLAHLAYRYHKPEVLETLVKSGMPIDQPDSGGYTALARAVRDQNLACVKQLLELGANPLSASSNGWTILAMAREDDNRGAGHDAIIDALLNALPAAGGDFNAAAPNARGVATSEDIQVSKPISLAPHRKGGFEL